MTLEANRAPDVGSEGRYVYVCTRTADPKLDEQVGRVEFAGIALLYSRAVEFWCFGVVSEWLDVRQCCGVCAMNFVI